MTDNKITPPPTALVMFLVSACITGFGFLMVSISMITPKTTGNVIDLVIQAIIGMAIVLIGFIMFMVSRSMASQPGSMKENKGDNL